MSEPGPERSGDMIAGGWGRLWKRVCPHPIEPGALGEYVALLLQAGLAAAVYAFPHVADHLLRGGDEDRGCRSCNDAAIEIRTVLLEELGIQDLPGPDHLAGALHGGGARGHAGTIRRIRARLERLPEEHRRVLELRLGLLDGRRRTAHEVAHALAVGHERVRQLEADALRRVPDLHGLGGRLRATGMLVDGVLDGTAEDARLRPRAYPPDGADHLPRG